MEASKPQCVIWPWQTRFWPDIQAKFINSKITSIVDMDSKIASMFPGKQHPRLLSELFTRYYNDQQFEIGRVPQDEFIEKILPHMQSMLAAAPKLFRGFNIAALTTKGNISFTRRQVATIIICIWFGLFNCRHIEKGKYPIESFAEPVFKYAIIDQNMFFLQSIMNYFSRVYHSCDDDTFNAGNIIVKRTVLTERLDWFSSKVPISDITIGRGMQDEALVKMHVAYASPLLGGVTPFKSPMSQEDVLLLTRPECMVAWIVCSALGDREVVTVLGAEKMSRQSGYGSSVRFVGDHQDNTPRGYSSDQTETISQCAVVFMDACSKNSGKSQFMDDFERDLNKAYCGFGSLTFKKIESIATGNWTYKYSGNNMKVKFLQQVLAASQSSKNLIYYPFGAEFEDELIPFIEWIKRGCFTVGELFHVYIEALREVCQSQIARLTDMDIFKAMMDS